MVHQAQLGSDLLNLSKVPDNPGIASLHTENARRIPRAKLVGVTGWIPENFCAFEETAPCQAPLEAELLRVHMKEKKCWFGAAEGGLS